MNLDENVLEHIDRSFLSLSRDKMEFLEMDKCYSEFEIGLILLLIGGMLIEIYF